MTPVLSKLGQGSSQFVPGGSTPPRGRSPEAEAREILTIAGR